MYLLLKVVVNLMKWYCTATVKRCNFDISELGES